MTCKCQDIPIGPSRAEAIRVAVEAERARWATALSALHADLWRGADSNGVVMAVTEDGAREVIDLSDDQCIYAAHGVRLAMDVLRGGTP